MILFIYGIAKYQLLRQDLEEDLFQSYMIKY